jgi:2-dehydropantoate 2-reductase
MRILVVGAGVIGSFNAARLKEAGQDVTLLARGRRLADLRQLGVVLENYRTGRRTTTQVPLVERLGPEDDYELALVIVRRNQIPSVLPMLAQNRRIPSVLFLGNNAAGADEMVQALGRERVLTGMVNAGGERDGYVVRYIWSRWFPILFAELDDRPTPRTAAIARMFRSAGLPARVIKNVEAYQKTHAAGVPPLAGALYMAGGDIRRLARMPKLLRLCVEGWREALRALRADGTPLRPSATRLMEWIPLPVLVLALRLFFDTRLAVVGGQRHGNAAPDEMKELADELREILRRSGPPSPACDTLFAHVDRAAQALSQNPTSG